MEDNLVIFAERYCFPTRVCIGNKRDNIADIVGLANFRLHNFEPNSCEKWLGDLAQTLLVEMMLSMSSKVLFKCPSTPKNITRN